MGSLYIATALLLIAIVAGMFLLYKTQKENLGLLFKIVSWTVIILATLALLCCFCRCVCKAVCGKNSSCHEKMMWNGKGTRCFPGKMGGGQRCFMWHDRFMSGDNCCDMMPGGRRCVAACDRPCCSMGNTDDMCCRAMKGKDDYGCRMEKDEKTKPDSTKKN